MRIYDKAMHFPVTFVVKTERNREDILAELKKNKYYRLEMNIDY